MVNSALYNRLTKSGGEKYMKHTGHHMWNLMGGGNNNSFIKLLNEKKEFLIAVFANLILQLGITYYFMMNYKKFGLGLGVWGFRGLIIFEFVIIFALALIPMPAWLKFILFSVFSICWGIILSGLKKDNNDGVIQMAILGTVSIFGVMFFIGALLIIFGIQLGMQFVAFLFYALFLLILVQIVALFSSKTSAFIKGIYIFSLVLFSLFVIYDTNNILQREYYGDFITASMDYYLDILNIFIDLVGVFGNNN
jgi:FtsH-binding integral membrane protein